MTDLATVVSDRMTRLTNHLSTRRYEVVRRTFSNRFDAEQVCTHRWKWTAGLHEEWLAWRLTCRRTGQLREDGTVNWDRFGVYFTVRPLAEEVSR